MSDAHDRDDGDDASRAVLDAWPAPEPPTGFTDKVLLARDAAGTHPGGALAPADPRALSPALAALPRRPRRRKALAALVATGVAAAVAVNWLAVSNGPVHAPLEGGMASAEARRSLEIGDRATAVVEPGASVAWRIDSGGEVLVEQSAGSVFYRVDRGGAFVVKTPAGEVRVLGTCFRVEVEPMGPKTKSMIAAGAGAAVTAAVLVTVYEGRVRVSNAHGRVEVGAGEQVAARADSQPSLTVAGAAGDKVAAATDPVLAEPPAADVSREELLRRDKVQREQIAMLGQRVQALEAEVAQGGGKQGSGGRPFGERVFDLAPEEWAQMAERCEIRFDLPVAALELREITPKIAEQAGFSPEEADAIRAISRKQHQQFIGELREIYIAVTGDTEGAQTLEPMAMGMEIERKSGEAESAAARRRIALEKAGKLPAPADPRAGTPIERYFRLVTSTGDRFEAEMAKIIGPARARELREDGPANRSIMSGCDDNDE